MGIKGSNLYKYAKTRYNMGRLIVFIISILFLISFTNALSPYEDCSVYGNCEPKNDFVISINETLFNVNNSDYLDGYHANEFCFKRNISGISGEVAYFNSTNSLTSASNTFISNDAIGFSPSLYIRRSSVTNPSLVLEALAPFQFFLITYNNMTETVTMSGNQRLKNVSIIPDVAIENDLYIKYNISAQCYTFQDGTTQCTTGIKAQSCPVGQVVNGTNSTGGFICTTVSAGVGGNPFDQELNTTYDVTFNKVSSPYGNFLDGDMTCTGSGYCQDYFSSSNTVCELAGCTWDYDESYCDSSYTQTFDCTTFDIPTCNTLSAGCTIVDETTGFVDASQINVTRDINANDIYSERVTASCTGDGGNGKEPCLRWTSEDGYVNGGFSNSGFNGYPHYNLMYMNGNSTEMQWLGEWAINDWGVYPDGDSRAGIMQLIREPASPNHYAFYVALRTGATTLPAIWAIWQNGGMTAATNALSYKAETNGMNVPLGNITVGYTVKSKDIILSGNDALKMTGVATVYEDVVSPITVAQLGATAPTFTESQYAYAFKDGVTEDYAFLSIQIPHSYKEGSSIGCHLHIRPDGTQKNNVTFELNYTWVNYGAVQGASAIITKSQNFTSGTALNHTIIDFGQITGTGKTISSSFLAKITRRSNSATDTYTGSVYVDFFDCHVERDSLGSRTEYGK